MRFESTHIHDSRVDVSKLLETKQTRAMSRVIEYETLERSVRDDARGVFPVDSRWWHKWAQLLHSSRGLAPGCKVPSALSPSFTVKEGCYLPSVKLQSVEVGRHCEKGWCFLCFVKLLDASGGYM
jgi:hypothetical protein